MKVYLSKDTSICPFGENTDIKCFFWTDIDERDTICQGIRLCKENLEE